MSMLWVSSQSSVWCSRGLPVLSWHRPWLRGGGILPTPSTLLAGRWPSLLMTSTAWLAYVLMESRSVSRMSRVFGWVRTCWGGGMLLRRSATLTLRWILCIVHRRQLRSAFGWLGPFCCSWWGIPIYHRWADSFFKVVSPFLRLWKGSGHQLGVNMLGLPVLLFGHS